MSAIDSLGSNCIIKTFFCSTCHISGDIAMQSSNVVRVTAKLSHFWFCDFGTELCAKW